MFRRATLPLLVTLLFGSVLAGQSPTPTPAPVPAQTPRPVPPETTAFNAAIAMKGADEKLAALEKIRTDFPQASNLALVDTQILTTLAANWPDRTQAITEVFDRMIGRIPADAAPDSRLQQLTGPMGVVVTRKVLLDKTDALMTSALAALDKDAFATVQLETAKRLKQPEPSAEIIDTRFGAVRARGLEMRARIAAARGDSDKAESFYKGAVDASPVFGTAVTSLVDIYTARKDFDKAEAVLNASIKAAGSPALAARPNMALADVYEKKGDDAKLEPLLSEAIKAAQPGPAFVKLAKLEARRGNNAKALEHYISAAVQGGMSATDDAAMRTLYKATNGNDEAKLELLIDEVYREKFPNPVKPDAYTPTAARTDRLVLLDMFTGSGCGPCVSADLALDAVMKRYPAGTIVSLAYHENIPAPDPMVTEGSNARRAYYSIRGVPTFNIDGGLGKLGGGARTGTPNVYKEYVAKIDKALETPATAALSVSATGTGDQIVVTADVTKLPADAKDLRLHILIVEHELKFLGENGIRFHPMVVRAQAGKEGSGIPITATGRTQQTFSLAAIKEDVTNTLKAEMEKRRSTEVPGATPRSYAADGRAYVAIDHGELSVVAFIQQGAYVAPATTGPQPAGIEIIGDPATASAATAQAATQKPATPGPLTNVLQTAIAEVVFASPAKGKGQ